MPDHSAGPLTTVGIGSHTSWAAAWSVPTVAFAVTDESIAKLVNQIDYLLYEGNAAMRAPENGLIEVDGALEFVADYNNMDLLLTAFFGRVGPAPGVYTFEDNLDDILRIEIDKGYRRYRIGSFKANSLELRCEAGQPLVGTIEGIGQDIVRTADAATSLSLSSWNPVNFAHTQGSGYLRLGDQVNDLAAGDNLGVNSFTLRFDRNLAAHYQSPDASHSDPDLRGEPVPDGFRDATLAMDIPRYVSDTIPDWRDAGTLLQSAINFVDGAETFLIELPEIKAVDGFNAESSGPSHRTLAGSFAVRRNVNNTNNGPPDMSAITAEARITIT